MRGKLPPDIGEVYDNMVRFGDNEWVPATVSGAGSVPTLEAAGGASYHTPADLAAYVAAFQASTQQIEYSFGDVLADEHSGSE